MVVGAVIAGFAVRRGARGLEQAGEDRETATATAAMSWVLIVTAVIVFGMLTFGLMRLLR